MRNIARRCRGRVLAWVGLVAVGVGATALRAEVLETADGQRLTGRIGGDAASGFRFEPEATDGASVPLRPGGVVFFNGTRPDPVLGLPPFQAVLGYDQRVSGWLRSLDATQLHLDDGPSGLPVAVARGGVLALRQRPGQALVLHDDFETLDTDRWVPLGEPALVREPRLSGRHSLRLPAGSTSLTYRLTEPVASGRLEVAFHESGAGALDRRWFVDLLFRGTADPQPIRVVLGWIEDSLAVETPAGPTLAVQRLARREGWHRLVVAFSPERTDIVVDNHELAHGKGPDGPLVEVRLACESLRGAGPLVEPLAGHLDDLRLARTVEPSGNLEVDPTQDEIRLIEGDQLFGALRHADAEQVVAEVAGRSLRLGWSEVAGVYLERVPVTSAMIEGLLVRAEWRVGPERDERDRDRVEGALRAVTAETITLTTPYAGTLTIPRERLRRLEVLGQGRRVVLDPTAHHLGDDLLPDYDPPQPEGPVLEVPFELDELPDHEPAELVLDVIGVVGEARGLPFSNLIREGQLRTHVLLNGQRFDYLNRHIASRNETPERIRLPIPEGLLTPGPNFLRFEQEGTARDPDYLDDLGLLGIALEFPAEAAPESDSEAEDPRP